MLSTWFPITLGQYLTMYESGFLEKWIKAKNAWELDVICSLIHYCGIPRNTRNNGPVYTGINHVPRAISERDSDPFLIWKPDFTLCEHKALSNQAFETCFETQKKEAFWIVIHVESLILRTYERKALSERDSCVRILEMRNEAMHGSISADCAVGTKYYLAVRRSCSWSGRRLQCMWTHIVQITIPITKRIAIRNGFRNVIRSFVNRPHVFIVEIFLPQILKE